MTWPTLPCGPADSPTLPRTRGHRVRCRKAHPSASGDAVCHATCAHAHSSSFSCPTSRLQPHLLLTTGSHSTDQTQTRPLGEQAPHGPGHHRTRPPWESKAQAHWHHAVGPHEDPSGVWARIPGGAQRAGSSPGAEAVRHPPCQTEETEKSYVTVCKASQGAGRAPRAQVLLPVKGIQGAEDDAAHGVVPPEEEPVGTRGRAPVRPGAAPRGHAGGAAHAWTGGGAKSRAYAHHKPTDMRRWASTSWGGPARGGKLPPGEEKRREPTAQCVGQEQARA